MPSFARLAFALAVAVVVVLGPRLVYAQTVKATQQPYPERFENGLDLGQSTRPTNLNPLGVNYQDCREDMILQFNLTLDGFTGSQNMQIWATANGDCSSTSARGINGIPTCRQLEGAVPNPPVVVNEGPAACHAQATFAAVPITVWFLPLDLQGNSVGTPFSQTMSTDLVGPPPPTGIGETVGDTLITVTWIPNTDADTTGYDVFMDPPPGQTSTPGPLSNAGTCTSTALSSGFAVSSVATVGASGVVGAGGGISTIPCSYILFVDHGVDDVGTDCYSDGETVTGESASVLYSLEDLTSGTTYDVVVAAVDGSGNVGLPSACVHDFYLAAVGKGSGSMATHERGRKGAKWGVHGEGSRVVAGYGSS